MALLRAPRRLPWSRPTSFFLLCILLTDPWMIRAECMVDPAATGGRESTGKSPESRFLPEDRFKSMYLRRIVKENHGRPIYQCSFAPKPPGAKTAERILGLYSEHECIPGSGCACTVDPSNIICTVGGAQLNTYDTMHCGDHLDLVSHFVMPPEPGALPADEPVGSLRLFPPSPLIFLFSPSSRASAGLGCPMTS